MRQADVLDEQSHTCAAHREKRHRSDKARRPHGQRRLGLEQQRRCQAQHAVAHKHPKRDDVDVHFATVLGSHRHLDGEKDRTRQRNDVTDVEFNAIERHQTNAR